MSGSRQPMRPDDDFEARFDRELSRVARALVTEELPRGILDHDLAADGGSGVVRARRGMPAFAGITVAVVLLVAAAIALVPGGGQPPSPSPSVVPSATPTAQPEPSGPAPTPSLAGAFRSTADIRADFERLRYRCKVGSPLLPTGPSPTQPALEGAICEAPADDGPYIAGVIVLEDRDGDVVQVHVKSDLTGEPTSESIDAIAVPLAKAAAIAASGQGVGDDLAAWVVAHVPALQASSGDSTVLRGFAVKIFRDSSGGYQLFMFGASPGA